MSKKNVENARRYIEDSHRFVRDFVGGVQADDVRRLFQRDATAAYEVLARDGQEEPTDGFKLFLYRTKTIFLGLAFQLTPARRLLFCACLLFAILGLIDFAPRIDAGRILVNASPFWFFWSIGGLIFLLMLELVDQIRVRDELEIARQLQDDLLPTELKTHGTFQLRTRCDLAVLPRRLEVAIASHGAKVECQPLYGRS